MSGNWIDCNSGRRPVDGPVFVEVEFRDGGRSVRRAHDCYWIHRCGDSDIVRYRVVPQQSLTEALDRMDATTREMVDIAKKIVSAPPTLDETVGAMLADGANPNYDTLRKVLDRAYDQAATGKGAKRHGQDLPFEVQPMQTISRLVGSCDGLRYQAIKKTQESARMDKDAAVRELLGAINYLAGAVIYLER